MFSPLLENTSALRISARSMSGMTPCPVCKNNPVSCDPHKCSCWPMSCLSAHTRARFHENTFCTERTHPHTQTKGLNFVSEAFT